MATFLLAWNPEKWEWVDLPEAVWEVARRGSVTRRWRCNAYRQARQGDRVFLMRLGREPKGIVGAGEIVGGPYQAPHYQAERAARGDTAWYVDVRFDALLDPTGDPLLPRERLLSEAPLSRMHWDIQGSGVGIPEDIAHVLERACAETLRPVGGVVREKPAPSGQCVEGAVRRIELDVYERDRAARAACLAHYGTTCVACGLRPERVYGEAGEGVIEVHHLTPLAEGGGEEHAVDPVRDLRPVCPNCHAVIHRRTPLYSVEEVQAFVTQARTSGDGRMSLRWPEKGKG